MREQQICAPFVLICKAYDVERSISTHPMCIISYERGISHNLKQCLAPNILNRFAILYIHVLLFILVLGAAALHMSVFRPSRLILFYGAISVRMNVYSRLLVYLVEGNCSLLDRWYLTGRRILRTSLVAFAFLSLLLWFVVVFVLFFVLSPVGTYKHINFALFRCRLWQSQRRQGRLTHTQRAVTTTNSQRHENWSSLLPLHWQRHRGRSRSRGHRTGKQASQRPRRERMKGMKEKTGTTRILVQRVLQETLSRTGHP